MSRSDAQEMVTITKKLFDRLTDDSLKLACFYVCGVDNWDGYIDAMHDYHEERGDYK